MNLSEINDQFTDQFLIYNRRSTDDALNQRNSLVYQKQRNTAFAQSEGIPIATLTIPGFCTDGVIDESHSAYKQEDEFVITSEGAVQYRILRPKFRILVEALNTRKFKGVIFLCFDRASRNDQDTLILKKLIRLGCDVRFTETTYDNSSGGKFHMTIDSAVAGHYSDIISDKVKNAQRKLRAEGRCIYISPIGYLDRGSDHKPLDPERAPIVKRIFELYSTGEWSIVQLAKWANEQGLTKKPMRPKRTKEQMLSNVDISTLPKISRRVDHKTIEYILPNKFYLGRIKLGNEWRDSKAHQALIDTALFQKVQNVLHAKNRSVHYPEKLFYTYRTLVRCTCGRVYTPYEQKGAVYYRSNCKAGCDNERPNLSETEITDSIQHLMDKIYFNDDELAEIETQAKDGLTAVAEKRDKKLSDLHARQRNIIADIEYLTQNRVTLMRTQAMTADVIVAEETRLNGLLNVVHEEIRAYGESAHEMLQYVISFSELVKNASLYFAHALDSERREIVSQVFYEIVIKNKHVENYRGKDGFDALLRRVRLTGSTCCTKYEPAH